MSREIRLSALEQNQSAVVTDISCKNTALMQRVISLGITEGSRVTALFQSPFHDPVAYEVKGCVIALRKSDSENIRVIKSERWQS